MRGLVLAAGAGRRLRPITDTLPKALAPVDGERSILDIALHNFAEVELTDVAVVVGFAADAVAQRVRELERRHGVRIELVHNERAEEWNNAYSLWCARDVLAEGALLANGDTVHPASVQRRLLEEEGGGVVLAIDDVKALGDEEMKVRLDDNGSLARITKLMDPAGADGEYIGLTLIDAAAAPALVDALEATWRRDPHLYYEDGYQELVDRGGKVSVAPIGVVDWVEVDTLADLDRAREIACRY